MADQLFSTTELSRRFGAVHALQGVSFAATGQAIGLLGPNGSGKSTLIKILLGLVRPTSGSASVLGLDSRHQALRIRQLTGFMPESECLIPRMNAVTFVSLAGQLVGMSSGDALSRAHDVLQALDLGEARFRDLETYSTGMLQRVKLAQALVHHPRLLFLDEPTNGLDPQGRDEMLALIRDISRKKGISVVLSSHILHDVESVCEQLVVLHKGRLAAAGAKQEIIGHAERALEVRFRGDAGRFRQELEREGLAPRHTQEVGRWVVPVADLANTKPVLRAAAASETQIRHLAPAVKSLDDVFQGLIEKADA
jgi:ABC-2 type transport system ATP-binding protein